MRSLASLAQPIPSLPCDEAWSQPPEGLYAFVFAQKHPTDYDQWPLIAKCLRLWDLDIRGFHKGAFRISLPTGAHMLAIGELSDYAKLTHALPRFFKEPPQKGHA
jgi:beta-1,2-N-acetylglucosaminyltransferase